MSAEQPENTLPNVESERFLKNREVGEMLNLTEGAVSMMGKNGTLPVYRFGPRGGSPRYRIEDVRAYIARSREKTAA